MLEGIHRHLTVVTAAAEESYDDILRQHYASMPHVAALVEKNTRPSSSSKDSKVAAGGAFNPFEPGTGGDRTDGDGVLAVPQRGVPAVDPAFNPFLLNAEPGLPPSAAGTTPPPATASAALAPPLADYDAVLSAHLASMPHVAAVVAANSPGGTLGRPPTSVGLTSTTTTPALVGSTSRRSWSWPQSAGVDFHAAGEEPIALFDGHSLSGWHGKHGRYWSVNNAGSIVGCCNPSDAPQVSTYLFSETQHLDFRLLFEMRLVQSDMHSGVGFWGRRNTMACPKTGQVEDDAWQGHLAILPTAKPNPDYNPGTAAIGGPSANASQAGIFEIYRRNWEGTDRMNWGKPGHAMTDTSSGNSLVGDQADIGKDAGSSHGWNQIELLCVGGRVRIVSNGVLTTDWTDPDPALFVKAGPIALQLHKMDIGQSQEVHFRGLLIVDNPSASDTLLTLRGEDAERGNGHNRFSPAPAALCFAGAWPHLPSTPFPAGENPISLFNGVDLQGWEGKIGRYFSVSEAGSIVAKNNSADPLGPSTGTSTCLKHLSACTTVCSSSGCCCPD